MKARVILADPPWKYNNRHSTRSDGKKTRFGIGVADRYSRGVMSVKDLCALPVADIAADDAYLFMWATWPCLEEALDVLKAWDFTFKTLGFIWCKTTKQSGFFYGPGRYVPSNTEPVLFAVRSRPWHLSTGRKPNQVIEAPHPRGTDGKIIHSRKPVDCHERIEQWLRPSSSPDDSWVELFATQPRDGWNCFGYDVTGRDLKEDLEIYRST